MNAKLKVTVTSFKHYNIVMCLVIIKETSMYVRDALINKLANIPITHISL